ncbi:MAG: hypothetical protein CVT84_01895 [Alphaproteobacteria bacterium HGW-Alphaproteobacteria-6]|nr:MAG: hypothetical protein CVT84_01895 [Alphaproteobacteria bacterium HGW-Alphaproteobacteria-6]
MTARLSDEAPVPRDLISATEELYREAAGELAQAIRNIRQGRLDEVKATAQAVRDLKVAFQLAMDERTRVEKLRKEDGTAGTGHAFDFDAARVEIGRRLARLRDAADG